MLILVNANNRHIDKCNDQGSFVQKVESAKYMCV